MATLYAGGVNSSFSTDVGSVSDGDEILLTRGSVSYTTDLDQSSSELEQLWVGNGFDGTIGAPGSSLQVNLDGSTYTGDFVYSSPGNFAYIAAASEIQRAQVLRTGSSGVYFTDGTVTLLEVASGAVSVNDQTDVPTLRMGGGSVTVGTHASQALDTVTLNGGSLVTERSVGTVTISKGATLMQETRTATATSLTVEGVLRWKGGTITTLEARSGSVVDFSGLQSDLTITNSTVWSGVQFIPPPAGVTITYTNSTTLVNGGTPLP
ncbi:MAG: hypothetical protein AAGB48_01865 [Planctomycetota bacterium]